MKILRDGILIATIPYPKVVGKVMAARLNDKQSIDCAEKIGDWTDVEFEASVILFVDDNNLTVILPDGSCRPFSVIKISEIVDSPNRKYNATIS